MLMGTVLGSSGGLGVMTLSQSGAYGDRYRIV